MVGKANITHLAGLLWGGTREYVSYILGPPASDPEQDFSGFGGYPLRRDDGLSIRVNYDNNVVTSVKVYSKGSRGTDSLLEFAWQERGVRRRSARSFQNAGAIVGYRQH